MVIDVLLCFYNRWLWSSDAGHSNQRKILRYRRPDFNFDWIHHDCMRTRRDSFAVDLDNSCIYDLFHRDVSGPGNHYP